MKPNTNNQEAKNKQGDSLDKALERLRDLHLNYKDLSSRCMVEIGAHNKNDKRVFYLKPDSFLLDEPEKQRQYRDKLIKKITTLPNPEPLHFMGDDLHKQVLETIQDRANPHITKKHLSNFYKRRYYQFQHKKYKLLLRWAHHSIAQENLERVGIEATQKYAKWEYDMENSINRFERLDFDDGYEASKTFQRPNTRAKEGGSLYVENTDLEPMSIIKQDDVEIYLRSICYDQKINRLMSKFLARIKWLPLQARFDIWNETVESYCKIKDLNIQRQEKLLEKIHAKGTAIIPPDQHEQQEEFKKILGGYYIQDYQGKIQNKSDKIMSSQKTDHQLAPMMVDNILELKVKIVDKSIEYGIYGDIELDQGYSFAYQITIFFPSYFQKQIIQSQFSLYDAFAGEESDPNSVQKRNLQNMVKIDTNIFKDISTTPNNVPSQEFLNTDPSFSDIKVTRMKTCSYWIDYVCVFPKVPAILQKQAAYLSTDNPIDSLLRSAMNFLDVNDLATVNKILEETSRLHQAQQKENAAQEKLKSKKLDDSGKPALNSVAINLRIHFMSAIKGEMGQDTSNTKGVASLTNMSLKYLPQHLINAYYCLRHMQTRDYKIKLLYCLNYFRAIQKRMMLDLKEFGTRERIYGDQIQPYLAPNEASKQAHQNVNTQFSKSLQEQQRIQSISERYQKSTLDGDKSNQDALSSGGGNRGATQSVSSSERQQSLLKHAEIGQKIEKNFNTVIEAGDKGEGEEEELDMTNQKLYDMKQYKYKGKFCNKIYSTCPVLPRFHSTFGEPVEFQPINVEFERMGGQKHISDEGVRLLGRVDHYEINEKNKQVFVKDDFGIYILYECAMQDMKDLEDELLKIGSYYISKHEHLVNTECEKALPLVDRITLLEDLLQKELDFQFEKVQLIHAYMETYEHIIDPLEQQRLIQVVVDLMATRPRLNLQSTYFQDSYDIETSCIKKHYSFLRNMIINQMRNEKTVNRKLQGYLDMTLRMTHDFEKGKWKYTDAEDFYNELKKRKRDAANDSQTKGDQRISNMSGVNQKHGQDQSVDKESTGGNNRGERQGSEITATQKFIEIQIDKQHASKYNKESQKQPSQLSHKESEGGFAAVLGLPTITVETLYQQYKEKDEVILEIMNEHSNYVKMYEGHPDFIFEFQSLQETKLTNYKFSEWSFPINVLDFYDSLNFSHKFYATLQTIMTELADVHKPHNYSFHAMMELKVLERCEIEYQKVKSFVDGEKAEYLGQEFLEEEAIVGNSEKIVFHIHDMMSNLAKAEKNSINPYIISKLDLDTIAHFDFPQLPKDQNQYLRAALDAPKLQQDFEVAVKIAENNSKQSQAAQSRYFSQLKEYMRKVNVPPMLNLYCNTVELLRLRQELIVAMSESKVLQDIYEAQGKLVNRPNFKPFFTDQVKFDNYLIDASKVNFIDDGPAATQDFEFAIKDFDLSLKSNINFRSPDAFKMLTCTSGLEEVRAILHYQLMHKQLLIIAVRLNQVVIDTHQRALNELELAKKGFSMPNSVIKVQNLFCKTGDGFSNEQYVKEKAKYANNIANNAANMFYQITAKKAKNRNAISKKFTTHLQTITQQHRKTESCLRIMRAYKVKMLHIYCIEIMRDAYYDCTKIQAITTCQKLRTMSQVFQIDEKVVGVLNYPAGRDHAQIFKFEDNEYFENFFCAYNPQTMAESQKGANSYGGGGNNQNAAKAINQLKMEIVDYSVIPSTMTLLKLEALSHEEAQQLADSLPNLLDPPQAPKSDRPEDMQKAQEKEKEEMWEEQENFIKAILPPIELIDAEYPQAGEGKDRINTRMYDFKQSYDYSHTQYGQLFSYYAQLERLMKFELSISKINSSLVEALQLEDSIYCGLPFWAVDPEQPVNKKKQHEQMLQAQKKETAVKMSEKVLEKIFNQKRNRINLAEEVVNLSNTLGMIISKAQVYYDQIITGKTSLVYDPIEKINEFMISHLEIKYYNLLHVIERLMDNFYLKGGIKEIKFLTELHGAIARRDHVKVSFKHNAFHVNGAFTRPDQVSIDPSNYFGYYGNSEEEQGFTSCIHPTINEKALNPPQVTLYEGIYGTQLYKTTQYAGQIPHQVPGCFPMLDTAFINFNDEDRRYINSTINSVRMLVIDYLDVIHKEKIPNELFEEQASVEQLRKCSKFLADLCKARQLKVALMCWISKSTLPMDPQIYNQVFQQYKNDIFWKVMNKKDSLPPITNNRPELALLDNKGGAEKKGENQLLQQMQSQVLVEQVQTCKAEIWVLSNEIQRNIINAASDAIESETAGISGCFNLVATPVSSHIHPFQQFASTLYSKCDPNSHLDMVTKLTEVQRFITKLNNRGTEVETLTSGPGMVFTIKDFNECLQILCRGLIKYGERSMRSRSEEYAIKEAHYINLLYVKDRKIENLEARIANTQENLDKLINSKMYEKGNQLIYELDNVNRQLRLFKDNVYLMEREIKSQMRDEFQEFFRKQQTKLDEAVFKFKQFRDDIQLDVGEEVSKRKEFITKEITKKAEEYKNKELGAPVYQPPGNRKQGSVTDDAKSKGYQQCLEGYMEEIDNMTEIEARQELAEMWTEMRRLRLFWKAKEVLTKDKYERQIFVLKKQLTSNACLWEQLAEAEKREKVFKQELVYTQQSLAASEKVIDKLKEDLRKSESDRIRLSQYKTTKAQRLEELEGKVRKFEVMDNINLEKLIDALGSKEKQIVKLKEIENKFNEKVDQVEKKKDSEIRDVKNSYFKELGMKREVMERLEGLRMELRLLEKNEGSMTEVWKTKCKELVEICNKLKGENEGLRGKITSIAMNLSSFGGGIASENDSLQQSFRQQQQLQQSVYEAPSPSLQLPKLMNNSAQNRLANNINSNKYGGGNSVPPGSLSGTNTRQSSIARVLDSTVLSPGDTQSRFKNDYSASKKGGDQNNNSFGKSIFNSQMPSSKVSTQGFGITGQGTAAGAAVQGLPSKGYQSTRTNMPNTPKQQQQFGTEQSSAVRHSTGAPSGILGKNYSVKNGSESENTYAQQMTSKNNEGLGKIGLSIDGEIKPSTALNNLDQ